MRSLILILLMLPQIAVAEPRSAVCRVHNRLATFNNVGSGTLVDKTDDGGEGLVLTCAHLFSEGTGAVVVEFPGGKTHGAKLVAIDHEADLAAQILRGVLPDVMPVEQNRPLGRIQHTRDQIDQSALAAAGVPDDSHGRSGRNS